MRDHQPSHHGAHGTIRNARAALADWLRKPATLALAVLVPVTSLAVATLSAWLVAPYLLLIAGVVFLPRVPLRRALTAAHRHPTVVAEAARASEPAAGHAGPHMAAAVAGPTNSNEPGGAVATREPSRPGRRRSRARAKPPIKSDEPPAPRATWVRVGPGKFVRVEEPESADEPQDPSRADTPPHHNVPAPHWPEPTSLPSASPEESSDQSLAPAQAPTEEPPATCADLPLPIEPELRAPLIGGLDPIAGGPQPGAPTGDDDGDAGRFAATEAAQACSSEPFTHGYGSEPLIAAAGALEAADYEPEQIAGQVPPARLPTPAWPLEAEPLEAAGAPEAAGNELGEEPVHDSGEAAGEPPGVPAFVAALVTHAEEPLDDEALDATTTDQRVPRNSDLGPAGHAAMRPEAKQAPKSTAYRAGCARAQVLPPHASGRAIQRRALGAAPTRRAGRSTFHCLRRSLRRSPSLARAFQPRAPPSCRAARAGVKRCPDSEGNSWRVSPSPMSRAGQHARPVFFNLRRTRARTCA